MVDLDKLAILDFGSGNSRGGWASEEEHRCYFPTIIGRLKDGVEPGDG